MPAFLLPLLGAAASGVGAAASGIGGLMGSAGLFGSAAAGGKAATAGLFGAGGTFGLTQALGTAGMGLGLMQAFGGRGSTGSAFQTRVNLSPEGQRLEKKTYETIKKQYEEGVMPANIASVYIGRIKGEEGKRARVGRGLLSQAAARRVGTGGGVKAALTESGARMEGLAAPTTWQVSQKEEEFRNALVNLQNLRNIELQTPLLRARGQFAEAGFQQMRGAAQGQALGDVAQWLAMLKYPPYQV